MEIQLQELIEQIKKDGVEAAETRAEAILEAAKAEAIRQLGILHEKALKEVGEANAAIFATHQMMLQDEDYSDSVCSGQLGNDYLPLCRRRFWPQQDQSVDSERIDSHMQPLSVKGNLQIHRK